MAKDYGAAVSQKGYDVKTCADRFLVYSSAFSNLKIFNVQEVSTTIPYDVGVGFQDFTVATNDVWTSAGHGLNNGDKIRISAESLTGGAGLNDHDIYYVRDKTTNTFKVSLTNGGTVVNVTSAGDGYWESAPSRITITHNLGYYAPFFVIHTGTSGIGRDHSYFFTDSAGYPLDLYGSNIRQYENKLEIDIPLTLDQYFDDGEPVNRSGETVYLTVIQFLDDFSTISARNINTGTTSGSSSTDYGIRISKAGYDVKTCTDEQCVFSSSFFNQIVHMKGSTTGDTVSHSLSYIPNFLTYTNFSGDDYIYYEVYPSVDSSIIDFTGMGADYTKYYIIFKDKMN